MKTLLYLPAALAVLCCPATGVEIESLPKGTRHDCSITVVFSSSGQGKDRRTFDAVTAFIEASADVVRAIAVPWGKEGEVDLCIMTHPNRVGAVYGALVSITPTMSKSPTKVLRGSGPRRVIYPGRM